MGEDLDLIKAELDEALNTIDDMVDVIGKAIINIAYANEDFVCTQCLDTAAKLYRLMKKYAREETFIFLTVFYLFLQDFLYSNILII